MTDTCTCTNLPRVITCLIISGGGGEKINLQPGVESTRESLFLPIAARWVGSAVQGTDSPTSRLI